MTADDFVGREPELDRLAGLLLGRARLITVVGAGGLGKTRLVTEATQRFRRSRRSPVHWVRLAPLAAGTDAAGIADAIVRAVVGTDFSARAPWQALVDTLADADAHSVLIMDNCEHLTDGVGTVITELIAAVPELTVLATSRRPIGWVDEQLVPLPPLTRRQAADLFQRRAELTGVTLEPGSGPTIDSICRRLHHYPLHIRLAAARLRHRPPTAILRDLNGRTDDARLRWPARELVGSDERHRGITDVIAWSFDLCGDQERLLFERMSVFAPGYDVNPDDVEVGTACDVGADLDAISAVCSGSDASGATLDPAEIEPLLERLADQSLMTVHRGVDEVRYSLLESLRLFAHAHLTEREPGEQRRLADRHRRYYRDYLLQAWNEQAPKDKAYYWARASWDNLLIALDGSLGTPEDAVTGAEIALSIIGLQIPFFQGSLRESRRWAEKTLARAMQADPPPTELRIAAAMPIAWMYLCQGHPGGATVVLEEALAICVPDSAARARWLLDPLTDIGVPPALEFIAACRLMVVDMDARSIDLFTRARDKFLALDDYTDTAICELFLALAGACLGDSEQARAITTRHLESAIGTGSDAVLSWAEMAWGIAEAAHGDARRAAVPVREALARQVATGDVWGIVWALHVHIWILTRILSTAPVHAQAVEMARLLGGAAAMRRELGVDVTNLGTFGTETDQATERVRTILASNEFDAAYEEGRAMRPALTEVTKFALRIAEPAEHTVAEIAQPSGARWTQLSAAEQDVAVLAAAGWTNSAIAARRGSSSRTVDAQVAAVLRKLAVGSRAEILPWVPPDRRTRVTREKRSSRETGAARGAVTARRRAPDRDRPQ